MEWIEFSVSDEVVVPVPAMIAWSYLVEPKTMASVNPDFVLASTASGTPGEADHTYFVEQLNHDGEPFAYKVRVLKAVPPEVLVTLIEYPGVSNTDHFALSPAGGGKFATLAVHSSYRMRVEARSRRALNEIRDEQLAHMTDHTRAHLGYFASRVALADMQP